ncbi:MAG: decarboxylase [Magnetovibrio sp.]|nr:decarboxylase [Magnetovibrio sp.]
MEKFPSARALARSLAPINPVTCLRPHAVRRAVHFFLNAFPGEILYAVKTNPRPEVLDEVYDAGVRNFDVASLAEIELIAGRYPDARMAFMNPVKNRDVIRRAYEEFRVRHFVLDSEEELNKIVEATGHAQDLSLLVRLAVPNHHSELELSSKYGVQPDAAPDLLIAARQVASRLGVAFHVGSQCMQPSAWGTALHMVRDLILKSGIILDIVDVGGGFPSVYPYMTPPPLTDYMREITAAVDKLPISESCEIWAEPGRALVAEGASTLVRVEMRRGDNLYINDGTYGSLFDAGSLNFIYPVRPIRTEGRFQKPLIGYAFYGPTCDSLDHMKGPFYLPADMREGDYIEIGQTGAYGCAMRTKFNGFHSDETVVLRDEPMLTAYGDRIAAQNATTTGLSGSAVLLEQMK